MKILLLDLGKNLGWALFKKTVPFLSGNERIKDLQDFLFFLTLFQKTYGYNVIGYEKPPTGTFNTQIFPTISKLNFWAGFLEGYCQARNIPTIQIGNKEIKSFFQNHGFKISKNRIIRKKQTINLIKSLLGIDKEITHDEADAITLGLIISQQKLFDKIDKNIYHTD